MDYFRDWCYQIRYHHHSSNLYRLEEGKGMAD
jgi:hypothetical protein